MRESNAMKANVETYVKLQSKILPVAFAAFLGLSIIYIAGHSQSHILHGAAHDVRHATGFPCH